MTLVSVVVIGRNEGERLRRCLESIAAMDTAGFETEIIYVDSGSTDNSPAFAEQLGARTVLLSPDRPSAALGRNAGWRAAAGNFILFLDGDTVLAPCFVREALTYLETPGRAVIWGHRRELHPERSVYNRVLDLDWIYLPGPVRFCGGDALIRRSVLEQTGGFDPTLIAGEEPELCQRIIALGFTIYHADLPMTGHDLAITHFRQYWKRSTRAGHAYAEVSARFDGQARPFWREESVANQRRALVLAGLAVVSTAASLLLRSFSPVICGIALVFALALRTAWKSRWKTRSAQALVLYGLHSHLQQIPIFIGQLQYWRNRRMGQHTALVEYK